ncbi:hypothetical protein OS128_09310 [Corynebacterium sp. P5848]|uniref:hypothetical protein n=1 Tax=Corynebacterium marambiense TaxID=2765364 RepID=UPI0022610366|nr:hypothetical protein [Corynebacterium marambiense]MCX7543114.1 hypothetical protein [Corynebacterium marambiense]
MFLQKTGPTGIPGHGSDSEFTSRVISDDRDRLSDLSGGEPVNLPCHIRTCTRSLACLRARSVADLDLTPESVCVSRELGRRCDLAGQAAFVAASSVHDAPATFAETTSDGRFDPVYAGTSALCRLTNLDRWAEFVAAPFRPGGRLPLRVISPTSCASMPISAPRGDPRSAIPLSHRLEPFTEDNDSTYGGAEKVDHIRVSTSHHDLGEIVTAPIRRGLAIDALAEFAAAPFRACPALVGENDSWPLLPDMPEVPVRFVVQTHQPV